MHQSVYSVGQCSVFPRDHSNNNDMFRISKRLAQAAESISRNEFLDAIAEVCPAAASSKHNGGLPLGEKYHWHLTDLLLIALALAISGGVDSMALALMCRTYLPANGTALHALVVDHGLRTTSHDEARSVKEVLTKRLRRFLDLCMISQF